MFRTYLTTLPVTQDTYRRRYD